MGFLKKILLALGLAVTIASTGYCNWIFNPFTNKLDYYTQFDTTTLKVYLTTGTASSTYSPKLYDIIISTTPLPGINFVCNGSSDNIKFNQAISACPVGGTVFVKAGTYVFNSSCTVNVPGITIMGDAGAVIRNHSGLPFTSYRWFTVTAGTVTIKGFTFNNFGVPIWQGIDYEKNAVAWIAKDLLVQNCGAVSNGIAFRAAVGADKGLASNITFISNQQTFEVLNYANSNTYMNCKILKSGSNSGYEMRGSYNKMFGCTADGASSSFQTGTSGGYNTIENCTVLNGTGGYNIALWGNNCTVTNNLIYNCVYHGIYTYNASHNVISKNVISTIGGSSNNRDGIRMETLSSDNSIEGNQFIGKMDRAPISMDNTCARNELNGNNMNGITNNEYYIYSQSSSTVASGNMPVEVNFDLSYASQTVNGKPNLVPKYKGTPIMTCDYNVWRSSGYLNKGDWDLVGGPPQYGEMWFHNDSSPYTQDLVQNVSETVACFGATTNGNRLTGFSYAASSMTCLVSGVYEMRWHVSMASSLANHKHHFWIAVNGVEQFNTENHCKPVNNSDVISCSGCGFLSLNVNDKVSLFVKDETNNETLTIYAANLNGTKIDFIH